MKFSIALLALMLLDSSVGAQQSNSGAASMTINGAGGPPYPILTNVPTNLPAVLQFLGMPNQPYAVFQTAGLQPGAAFVIGGSVDLSLNPFPVAVIDGFTNPGFTTNSGGTGGISVQVPAAGNPPTGVPLGLQVAVQAVVANPTSPFGLTLTAATRVTVVQGPVVTVLALSDGSTPGTGTSAVQVNLPFPIPFYGANHTQLTVAMDGYVAFGFQSFSEYAPSDLLMNAGPPRCAMFWTDLVLGAQGSVTSTVHANPGAGQAPWVQIQYNNLTALGSATLHNFSMRADATGSLQVTFGSPHGASIYDQITGIGPGNNLSTSPMKDLSTLIATAPPPGPGSYIGAVNESLFEWFGLPTMPFYTPGLVRPFDLFLQTLHFLPVGSGSLPGSTNQYALF